MLRQMSPAKVRLASNSHAVFPALLLSTLMLAACGGGGGGDSSPPPSSPSTQPPAPSTPTNTAPTVKAGPDQTITLPTATVDLSGSADDAENNPLTYTWTASPATGVTFANSAAAATQATFSDAGTYTLTLTANDGTTTGTDTVQVIVNPASTPPPPPPPPPSAEVWPGADSETDPNHGWVAATPAEVGMDPARLVEAQNYALTGGGAGIITRHGKLVQQWTDTRGDADPANDIDIDTRVDLKSTTKSMGGIALGLALDEGKIALGDLAKAHLSNIGTPPANDPAALDVITILQLATHTAGFEKKAVEPAILYGPPGTQWFYSDGSLNWLANLLTTKYGQDLNTLLTQRVWTPLQITNDDLIWDAGTVDANGLRFRTLASGIVANSNAMARIGLLYLRKGMWNGTRILSESSVQLAATPRSEIAGADVVDDTRFPNANLNYGLLWWTNATKQLPDVPADAYWAWGLGDSLIVVIPSLDIVIARVGSGPGNTSGPHWRIVNPTYPSTPEWDGNYEILRPFLTPIAQSVTTP